MGTSLNGTAPQNTYSSLIKVGDNGAIDANLQRLSDGDGNDLPLLISTTDVTNLGGGNISSNTAFGSDALIANTNGTNNTAIGLNSLKANTEGVFNTAIGSNAMLKNIDGSTNTAIGHFALSENLTGQSNTAVGVFALDLNLSQENTAVGYGALGSNSSGGQNTAIGAFSLPQLLSGSNNTTIGKSTGLGITTGSNNTILGANVSGLSSSLSGNIILANGSGTIRIQTNSSGATSFLGNELRNFIPRNETTSINLTINSANQDTFCGAVLEVTGALTITFDGSIRDGFNISVVQKDANSTTFAVTGGLTLRNRQGHTKTFGQWSTVTLYNDYANNLILAGDTAA